MGSAIKTILEITWKYATPVDRTIGITLLAVVVIAGIFWAQGNVLFLDHKALWIFIGAILYYVAIVPPVKRMTARRHELVFYVSMWGLLSLIVFLVAFYAIYYCLLPDSNQAQSQWDRILNLPPVFAALFGTAIGWYVHQELSAKVHRTNNSFNLVMQTRTCAEFLKHTRNLYAGYPPPMQIPVSDAKYFPSSYRSDLEKKGRELLSRASPSESEKLDYTNDLAKVEAIEGLKYLLNFFEFMAFGVHAGDLDETLLYETISPSVVGWYSRSQNYCAETRASVANKLAYEHLHKLVKGYKTKVGNEETQVNGWELRLDIEKASKNITP